MEPEELPVFPSRSQATWMASRLSLCSALFLLSHGSSSSGSAGSAGMANPGTSLGSPPGTPRAMREGTLMSLLKAKLFLHHEH